MDYLDREEQAQIEVLRRADPFVDETLRQCVRILASDEFAGVHKEARDFLCFVVNKKLLGREVQIKEAIIAIHVYSESTDFNPTERAKIRVAAGNLRNRLSRYYENEGSNDPIEIRIPVGTYVPQIQDRRISVAVSLFENWNPMRDQDHLCVTVRDEIAHQLTCSGHIEAGRVAALHPDVGSKYGLRGSLECRGDVLRLNVSLSDLECGKILSDGTFEGPRDDLIKLSREVAKAILMMLLPQNRRSLHKLRSGGKATEVDERPKPGLIPRPPNTV